jgi:hypothetical protein
MRRRTLIGSALAAPLVAPAIVRAQETAAGLLDLARRATIYLFPVYEMYRTRWQATVNEANPLRQRLNRFRHIAQLADHRARSVTAPNNDTFYSSAWLDLSLEPWATSITATPSWICSPTTSPMSAIGCMAERRRRT